MPEASRTTCPHCGARLEPFALPDTFDHEYDLACFNDACPYYVRGWTWMEQQYGVRSSYRYRVDGQNGLSSPLAVWSSKAIRSSIIDDGAASRAGSKEHA